MPTSEEWRAIPSHPAYEVSRAGQIRRIGFARILKPATSHGYLHLSLGLASKNNRVHRLVARTPDSRRVDSPGYHPCGSPDSRPDRARETPR